MIRPIHPILQQIRGMCVDEKPYPAIDRKLGEAVDRAKNLELYTKRLEVEIRRLRLRLAEGTVWQP